MNQINLVKCKNVGCPMEFKFKMQMYRHLPKCKYPPPSGKGYESSAGKFKCSKCDKKFSHQPSVIRHLKSCDGIKKTTPDLLVCEVCDREFRYKSKLDRHIKQCHSEMSIKKCQYCNREFTRVDHLKKHIENCDSFNEQFIPTFTNIIPTMPVNELVVNAEEDSDIHFQADQFSSTPVSKNLTDNVKPTVRNRNSYFKENHEISKKSKHLEEIICNLKSPIKKKVIRNLDKDSILSDVLINTTVESIHEGKVVNSLIQYLKNLNNEKKYPLFHSTLNKIFCDDLSNEEFCKWLALRLGIRPTRFLESIGRWKNRQYVESRGRTGLDMGKQQLIYDTWVTNSINSTDARNGRNVVKISKRNYLESYSKIENKDIVIEEKVNRRGRKYFHANKMIVTCTTRNIQKQLSEVGLKVSLGKILSLRPFFVMLATEKELSLCLCLLCLNVRMMYNALYCKAKKDGDNISDSITEFFMDSCECPKDVNGYYSWKCVNQKCQQCKSGTLPQLKCQNSTDNTKLYQFEKTEKPYEKIDKNGNKIMKTSNKTEKVEKLMTWGTLYKQLKSFRKQYVCHKYQVNNDRFHWKKILATVEDYGEIYHMDFSENLSQMYKYEPQSSHFNKQQYSLHCTVKHTAKSDHPYEYIYHLSDVMKHNYIFTSAVVDHVLETDGIPSIIRFKSDNCATQYKSKNVFRSWSNLAAKHGRKVLVYYGVSGHGKGLVDAMSSFGVKAPLRKAVITNDFTYSSALDIYNYLITIFQNDNQKHHYYLEKDTINLKTIKNPLKITGCQNMHMICFNPDNSFVTKINVCSCESCLIGEFLECDKEKGIQMRLSSAQSESSDEDDDEEDFVELESDYEEMYEMRADSVIDVVEKNSVIALYSPPNALEIFYLCYVLDICVAEEQLIDKYNHVIEQGCCYLKCNYYEKVKEQRSKITYKPVNGVVYVLPTQVLSPLVPLNAYCELSVEEYQWLCDSI